MEVVIKPIGYYRKYLNEDQEEININITENKSLNISEFILSEVEKEMKKLEIEEI